MSTSPNLFYGRYVDLKLLHEGRFAEVYDAYDKVREERVAVKVLSLTNGQRDIAEAMFRREVDALRGFEHPAVVRFLEAHQEITSTEARVGLALELVPGRTTLETLIAGASSQRSPLPSIRTRAENLRSLLDGLDAAHKRHIIHRDIKPSNILINTSCGAYKIADFGIARLLENYPRGKFGTTLQGFHSPPYSPPEQLLQREVTSASDLYAFALVMAAALSLRLPRHDFQPDGLPALLEPLRDELADDVAFAKVRDTLQSALLDDPRSRPRAVEIRRMLDLLLEQVAERREVRVHLTSSARNSLSSQGVPTPAVFWQDLREGLRASYHPDSGDEGSFYLKCFGRYFSIVLREDRNDPEQLSVVSLKRLPETYHKRERARAAPVPFMLVEGSGSGKELVEAAHDEFIMSQAESAERSEKERLLSVSKLLIALRRSTMISFRVRYQMPEEDAQKARRLAGGRLDIPTGKLRVKLLEEPPSNVPRGQSPRKGREHLATTFDGTSFLLDGKRFASFHAYDAERRMLTLQIERRVTIASRGEFECKDLATASSLKRQSDAMDQFFSGATTNKRLDRLLLHPEENSIGDRRPSRLLQPLQPERDMRSLVSGAMAAQDFYLVQGPPGTGKTTVIVELIAQILQTDPDARILLTSQSNEAVDNVFERLHALCVKCKANWRLLRDMSPDRRARGGGQRGRDEFAEWAEGVRARSREALERLTAETGGENLAAIRSTLLRWQEQVDHAVDVRQDFAEAAQVLGATCLRVPALSELVRELRFDWVIVDEAGRATPAEVLVSLVVGERFILVGDHLQLPPFLDNTTAKDLRDLGVDPQRARVSLFEDLYGRIPESNRTMLKRQYRMHRSIGDFVSTLFYAGVGGLETGVEEADRGIEFAQFDRPGRVFWLDVTGHEQRSGTSSYNDAEVGCVADQLLVLEREAVSRGVSYTVGVIAPYAAQVERLRKRLVPSAKTWKALSLRVDTVDAFQGRETDVIIYSLVRTSPDGAAFVSDRRRLNVAFSRAKRLLLIVGDRTGAMANPLFRQAIGLIPLGNVLDERGTRGGGTRT